LPRQLAAEGFAVRVMAYGFDTTSWLRDPLIDWDAPPRELLKKLGFERIDVREMGLEQ